MLAVTVIVVVIGEREGHPVELDGSTDEEAAAKDVWAADDEAAGLLLDAAGLV